jgi:hypothetical protein
VASLLLDKGAKVNAEDADGMTPLDIGQESLEIPLTSNPLILYPTHPKCFAITSKPLNQTRNQTQHPIF